MGNKKLPFGAKYAHRRHRTRKIKSYLKPPWVRMYKRKKRETSIEEIEKEGY